MLTNATEFQCMALYQSSEIISFFILEGACFACRNFYFPDQQKVIHTPIAYVSADNHLQISINPINYMS